MLPCALLDLDQDGEIITSIIGEKNEDSTNPWERTDCELAVTGPAFMKLQDTPEADMWPLILKRAKIFARMSPEGKGDLVVALKHVTGRGVGMCGDGANDCNALNRADVGLSLSEAEASIAAPFTSKIPNITPILLLLREGRCCLTTCFSLFKFVELYSVVQFMQVSVLYFISSNLGDWQFLYIDIFLIIPFCLFMGNTKSYPRLSRELPQQSLLNLPVLFSILGHFLIVIGLQIAIFWVLSLQSWFVPLDPSLDPDDVKNIECMENTTLFLFGNFQYVGSVLAFSVSKPFRKPIYTNIPLLLIFIVIMAMNSFVVVFSHGFFWKAF